MTDAQRIRVLVIGIMISLAIAIGSMMQTAKIKRQPKVYNNYNVYTNQSEIDLEMIKLEQRFIRATNAN